MNDKDLAEFIIDLATKNPTLNKFRAALLENGAEFADSFIENLLRIIQHMAPGQQGVEENKPKLSLLREQLPCLALPDNKVEKEEKEKSKVKESAVDNMMEFLESMAPSKQTEEEIESSRKQKKKKRSRSRDRRRDRKRSRDRSRREKSRSRSRDRDRRRRSRSRSYDGRRGKGGVEEARKVAERVVDKDEVEQFRIYSG